MVNLGKKRMARELFEDWRSRRGVKTWALANYLQCLSRFRKRGLEEVIATCKDALADLPHDHCSRYLACMQAEACALSGDKSGLLDVWQLRRGYFGGDLKPDEYFRANHKYLLYDIPDLVEALQHENQRSYRKRLRTLRFRRLWNEESRKRLGRVLRIALQLITALWFFGMAEGFFRRKAVEHIS